MTLTQTGGLATIDRRRPPLAVPAAIALAWVTVIALHASGRAHTIDHDQLFGSGGQSGHAGHGGHGDHGGSGGSLSPATLVAYSAAWVAMVIAMMLPSATPLVRLFASASRTQVRPRLVVAVFVSGYVAIWSVFGWIALGLDAAVHAVVHNTPLLHERPYIVTASVLAVAGAFQFSSLKDRCLKSCRHPAAYLIAEYRRGIPAAFRIGSRHGLFCLGCCWSLMLVAFAAGMADLRWMAAFTALMTYEKIGRRGEAVAHAAGVVLLGLAAVVVLRSTVGA
jgi:predicted metal-binding membrane protein